MKKLIFIAAILGFKASFAFVPKDTTIIEFDDKTAKSKVKVITNDKKTFEFPKSLNLDNVLKTLGVDSSEREKAIVLISKGKATNDTLLVISREGQKIKIVTKEMVSKKDTLINDKKDSENDEIRTFDEDYSSEKAYKRKHDEKPDEPKKPKKFFAKSDFGLYVGLNNFTKYTSESPERLMGLRNLSSRYVALSFRKNATLVRGEKVDWALSYGPEIAWYNFMFKNSNVADMKNNQVVFVKNTKETEKSKLVMPYLNFPVMFNFGFKEEKFKIGFGGYAGYRVGGYTKEKYTSGGKNKVQDDFGFNDFIYGLTAEIGKKNGLTLFGRYDLNKLFKENQVNSLDTQAFSVGLRF